MGQQDIATQHARVSAKEAEESRLNERITELTQAHDKSAAEVTRLQGLLKTPSASVDDETSPTEDKPEILSALEQRVLLLTASIDKSTAEAKRLGELRQQQQTALDDATQAFKQAAAAKTEKETEDNRLEKGIREKTVAHTNLKTNIETTWPQHLNTLKDIIYSQLCFDARQDHEMPNTESGEFEGRDWYLPKYFPLSDLRTAMPVLEKDFTIGDHHTVTWEEFKQHSESSVGGWYYRGWENSESPRKLLLDKVKAYIPILDKQIKEGGPEQLQALSEQLKQYGKDKQALQPPLTEARSAFTSKQAEKAS